VESVTGKLQNANTATYVPIVRESIPKQSVQRRMSSMEYMHPRFAWDLIWGDTTNTISPAAQYSSLQIPPQSELENCTTLNTIHNRCISISELADLLEEHPNQPFVQSVTTGLHKGFGLGMVPHYPQ